MLRRPRPGPPRRAARVLAALLAVLPAVLPALLPTGLPGSAPVAAADTTTPPTPSTGPLTTPAATDGRAPLVVLLDASGSMALEDASGTRFDRAKQELDRVLRELPDDTTVSVLVYGTRTTPDADQQQRGCSDVVELVPPGPLDADAVREQVDTVVPSGYSPIGLALRQAAGRLPASGPASVLLVSDGFDVCPTPEPCPTAQEIHAANPQLTVSVLAIQPDAAADTALRCLSSSTGGSYLPVVEPDPDATSTVDEAERSRSEAAQETARTELSRRLAAGYQRRAAAFTPDGAAVSGGATAEQAPELLPGDHLDTGFVRGSFSSDGSQKNGTARYYRLPLGDGMTPWVSATASGTPTDEYQQLGIRVGLVDADDDACLPAVDQQEQVGPDDVLPLVTAATGGVRIGGTGWAAACSADEPVYLRVERLGDYRFGTATPVRLTVRQEPPVTVRGAAAATAGTLAPPTATGDVPTVAAGTGFGSAPLLAPGGSATDTVVSGESRFWAVTLGWGQRLRYRVEPLGEGTPVDAVRGAAVTLRGPLLTELPVLADSQGQTFAAGSGGQDWPGLTGSTPVAVQPANRTAEDDTVAAYSLPGTYYLVLTLAAPGDAGAATVPYRVTVAVEDAGASATPSYGPAVAPPATAASTTGSAALAGSAAAARPLPTWWWVLAGGAVVLLLTGAVVLVSRRRSSGRSRPPARS